MPNLNPNSTNYFHSFEPNTNDLTMAMDYTEDGKPAIRVLSNIQGDITVEGDVTIPGIVTVTNTDDDPLFTHTHIYDENDVEYSAANPLTIDGTVTVNQPVAVTDNGGSLTVDGSVSVSNFPATYPITDNGGSITVDGTVTANVTFPTTQQVSGTVTVQDGGGSITVDGAVSATVSGTVELGATTLSALENTTVTISGTPTVNIGTMPEVEIKNDAGNPIPVSGTVNIGTMPSITITDTSSEYTSKKRLKISTYETQFFNTFQFNKETDVWDEATTTGGSAVHDPTVSGVIMQVNSTAGAEVIRQTRNVMRYIPGRSSELSFAVRLETPVVGVRRRLGLFDEKNGFYFEDGGDGNYYCCIRNFNGVGGPTLTRIPREQWNGDRLDGLGISGITANPSAQQLVVFDYEWYGAGTVVFKFIIDGTAHTIHTFYHANRIPTVWCATPFLPIRLEITNVTGAAGTHRLFQGSNSLISEGEVGKLGIAENITTNITGKSLGSPNTFRPVLSIRLKSTALSGIVLPAYFQAVSLSNANIFYKIIYNAVLTGAAWTDMPDANSFTQYDETATAYTGGRDIDSGFVSVNAQGLKIELDQNTRYQLGRGSLGTVSDTLTLAMASPTNNATAAGSMTWIEQR